MPISVALMSNIVALDTDNMLVGRCQVICLYKLFVYYYLLLISCLLIASNK